MALTGLAAALPAAGQILILDSQSRSISGSVTFDGAGDSFSVSAPDARSAAWDDPASDDFAVAFAVQQSGITNVDLGAEIRVFAQVETAFYSENPAPVSASASSTFDLSFRVTQETGLRAEGFSNLGASAGGSNSFLVELQEDGIALFSFSGGTSFSESTTLHPDSQYRFIVQALAEVSADLQADFPAGPNAFVGHNVGLYLAPVPEPATGAVAAGVALAGFGLWRRMKNAR